MATRSNGGIYGPQNRSTSTKSSGLWRLYDEQQAVGAKNWFGVVPTVPQVLAGTATQTGTTTASVPFTIGYDGGDPVTSVTVTSIPGGIVKTVTGTPPTSPVSVTGLTSGTTYQFQVVATNSVGNSTPSYTNSITTPLTYSISYLAIAGGGGGGAGLGSGAGGGGYQSGTLTLAQFTAYTATVGDGGAGSTTGATSGTVGSNSTFSSVTANGGGAGAGVGAATVGGNGGSGGGGGWGGSGGTGSQGSNGGTSQSIDGTWYTATGGGGASQAGANGTGTQSGKGGDGTASSITGSSVTYAGGGGGGYLLGGANTAAAGAGGAGGGGAGSPTGGSATAGTVNTGGGGGGGAYTGGIRTNGANGGKGVIILSIPTAYYSGTVTGSPTVTTSGANTIVKFTGTGTYTG